MLGDGYVDSRRARYIFENFVNFGPFLIKRFRFCHETMWIRKKRKQENPIKNLVSFKS